MKLFISKEKFAGINGYENVEDFVQFVERNGEKTLTTDIKVNQALELIKKHSR